MRYTFIVLFILSISSFVFAKKEETLNKKENIKSVKHKKGKKVFYPKKYRSWTHVKSMAIVDKKHPLFDAFEGIHHIYANPKALKSLKEDISFPDNSVIVFDLLKQNFDGTAYTEGERKFVAVMHKHEAFYKDTDGWGWEVFIDGKPQLKTYLAQKACATCHKKTDAKHFVFASWRE